MRSLIPAVAFLACLPAAYGGHGQEPMAMAPGEELVDRLVAVVGDSAIFESEVGEQILRLQAAGEQVPQDEEGFRELERRVLEELVNQTLILKAAEADTLVTVPPERVEETLERAWAEQVARFGGEEEFLAVLERAGQTLSQFRSGMRSDIRRSLMYQQFMQQRMREGREVAVDESEIRAFYERERESMSGRPATIAFRQVVLIPSPSDSVRAAARAEAERVLELLREGDDFGDLARRFSDDPGSADQGGELGWIRQGTMVQEFEDVAFALGRGQTSGVVETSFGAHIIRVDRERGGERFVRHILIAALPTDDDVAETRARAEEVRQAVEAGTPIEEFADEGETGLIPDSLTLAVDQLGQLPSAYASALRTAAEGDVVGPVEFEPPQGRVAFAVVRVGELRDEGEFTYEEVRDQIRERLQSEKLEERILENLRSRYYVEIRW